MPVVKELGCLLLLLTLVPVKTNAGSGSCTGVNSNQNSYSVSVQLSNVVTQKYTVSCGFWGWRRCNRYRTVIQYSTGYQVLYNTLYVTTHYCCPGYEGSAPSNCNDINECSTNNGGCAGTCTNTAGSYYCTCPSGCTLGSDGHACNDNNECSASTDLCEQNCHNTENCEGKGYDCSCDTGYTLDSNGYSCNDINECSTSNGGCAQTCHNTVGSYYCTCGTGYSLASNNHDCNDVDECSTNKGGCVHVCTNTVGSFVCSCNTGYELDSYDCIDINECSTNNGGCAGTCTNTIGSYYCTCSSGCTLGSNGHACNDNNECSAGTDNCVQNCHNTGNCGGFYCSCNTGYTLDSNGYSCNDINECSSSNGGCAETCHNTVGSYYCTCPSAGYTLAPNNHNCGDINECNTNNGGCSQVCTNTIGSFVCSCNTGYELDPDECIDINECSTTNGGCTQTCQNTAGSYYCVCGTGYSLASNNHGCDDVNECSTNKGGCNQVCTNNIGSFVCSCNTGYELESDERTCVDTNECGNNNGGCSQTCHNTVGSYYCTCGTGYTLSPFNHGCDDINECSANNGGCGHVCTNTVGSFVCSCNTGYELDSDETTCSDINECSTNNGGCAGTCTNTAGSYYCTCSSGCTLGSNGHVCNDNNECSAGTDNCEQNCHNTANCGGFYCSCDTGYTLDSDSCNDINECSTSNGGCAQTCHNTAGSYYCTCNAGYTLASNNHGCDDVNPCFINNGGCNQVCTNTLGSFFCSCNTGYELDSDERTCVDTNECGSNNGGCTQTCHNTVGSYYCTCGTGYTLASNNHGCNDVNECSTNNGGCSHVCTNTVGSFVCSCNTGYELDSDETTCSDINECSTNNGGCAGTCTNTAGSYYCTCSSGCTLGSNGHACNDNNECSAGTDNCEQNCHNTGNCGGFDCSCNTGYTLDSNGYSCNDINECSTSNGGCAQTCHNTAGSYYCTCGAGYTLASNNHGCNDVNECSTNVSGCNQVCTNTIGSFLCSCNTGYELDSDARTCVDTNECGYNNGGCVQNCHNTVGSYFCTCNSSYTLNSNKHACDDINECTMNIDQCHHTCINTIGSYICDCNVGYMLDSDGLTCTDVDECTTNNGGCDQNCHNTVGSYYCTCNIGYLLDDDEHGCSDHHECNTNNDNCDQNCTNTHGSFYCSCGSGWRLDPDGHTCNDTNECQEHSSGCTQICNNTLGSYFCTCYGGYSLAANNHTCVDVNECDTNNGGCEQNCNNNVGSYSCTCDIGYQLGNDYHECPDVDECATANGNCDQDCYNTNGSYYCTCGSGWRLDPDGHTCNDTNECEEQSSGCTQTCNNTLGSYFCTCYVGYSLDTDNHTCFDIDECATGNGGCDQNCHNTVGSYYCTCNIGYLLDDDEHGCSDVDECATANGNCDQDCHNTNGSYYCTCGSGWRLDPDGHTCNDTNECKEHSSGCTQICNNTLGSYFCTCYLGFSLDLNNHSCNDINECDTSNGKCEQNCNNTIGSYFCTCDVGYQLANDYHSCPDIDECATANGNCDQNCHNTNGSYYCTCGSGWRLDPDGHTCNDTNECSEGTSGCTQICNNTLGSYFCICYIGYSLQNDNHTCIDIDECATDNGGCDQNCHNTTGSYYCTCNIGYLLDDDKHGCNDVDECATANGNCDQDCHNTNGSYYCTCGSGWRLDPDGHTCNDTNECKEHSSGCTQICNNTLGSYFCVCFTGFSLDQNNHSCSDIVECDTNNGGCEQNCNNTVGSYYCTCDIGFQLGDDYHECPDVDECSTANGNCDQNCHNTYGSYYCTCDSGWRLDPDGHTCNDTDECEEHSSGCTQICNNTPGSYFCTCLVGYSLSTDNHTCNDINECNTINGGCAHVCNNSIGSYQCSCRTGYDLNVNNHGCDAQPCEEPLYAPHNGTILCTGDQVTDQNCSFTCDAGFTFTGSELRECLSDNSWTGVDVVCIPKHCDPLTNPPNGYVDIVVDCETVLTTACEIKCVEGYYINDTTPFYQTCVANQTSGGVYWTMPPVCELIPPCTPNPCLHSGVCSEVDITDYSCDCFGTHYKGKNCEIGIVNIPVIPILTVNLTSNMLYIIAFPDDYINITFIESSALKISPSSVIITSEQTSKTFAVTPKQSGKFLLTYNISGSNSAEFESPLAYVVLSIEPFSIHSPNRYFTDLGLELGLMVPGCCMPGTVSYQCATSSMATVAFTSSCNWFLSSEGAHVTDGIVFANGSGLLLPISIGGIELSPDLIQTALPRDPLLTCTDCGGTDPHCYHYDFSVNDVVDLLHSMALGKTYLHNMNNLMPSWLSFSLSNTTIPTAFSLSNYYTSLTIGENIASIQGCERLNVDQNDLFSILTAKNNLTISNNFVKREFVPTENDPPVCFAVNLCQGLSSSVHVAIPASSHDTIASFDPIKQYIDQGWEITFVVATLSSVGVLTPFSISDSYWNGDTKFDPDIPNFDLHFRMTIRNTFINNNLWVAFSFSGDMYHQANPTGSQIEGVLYGDISLSFNLTIAGESARINMHTDHQPAVFSMPDYSITNLPGGASFKLRYAARPDFFKEILPLLENEQSCPTDVFVKFSTISDLSWISFTLQCSGLLVSNFRFPAESLSNHVYLSGSLDPPTPDSNWEGAIVQVYTQLASPVLLLNQYLSILQPLAGPALSAGYWMEGKQEGKIYNALFSLLGTNFTTTADINNGSLRFYAVAEIFGKYNSHLSGFIPGGHSWDNAPVSINGEFDANNLESFQNYSYNQMLTKIGLAEQRIYNADAARNNTQQQLENAQLSYNRLLAAKQLAESEYQQALQAESDTVNAVNIAQAKVNAASMVVTEAQNILTNVCELEECMTDCVPGVSCQSCINQVDFGNWAYCDQTTTENKLNYRVVLATEHVCVYEHQCRITTKITGWASTLFGQACSYVCLANNVTREVEEAYYMAANVSHTVPCLTSSTILSINQVCCSEQPCSQMIPNIACLYRNALCELARTPAYNALNQTEKLLVESLLELSEAKINHSIAMTLVAATEAKKNLTNQEFLLILPTYLNLTQAIVVNEANYQMVLEDEQPILQFKSYLSNYSIENLLQIKQMRFFLTIDQSESPSIIPMTVSISIPLLNQTFVFDLSLDLTAPDNIVKRNLFNQIFTHVLEELAAHLAPNVGKRRRAIEMAPANVDYFETSCATLINLKEYFAEVNQTLASVLSHFESSIKNMSNTVSQIKNLVNFTLSNASNVNFTLLEEQFGYNGTESDLVEQAMNSSSTTQVLKIVNSIVNAYETLLQSSEINMFIQWQLAMNGISAVGERNCFGLIDCLTVSATLVQELLEDMPIHISSTILIILPSARHNLTELALATNLSLVAALSKTALMADVITQIEATNYWCSSIPTITEQPERYVSVDLGHQFTISCQANSTTAYSWKKNGFILLNHSTNSLSKLSATMIDEGKYQCLASNPKATTPSLYSTVTVFEPPVITQSPSDFTTYESDDNGALFVCNASASPSPNYQWYWSPDGEMWTAVVNGTSNELFLSKPRNEQEGWYRCQAFTEDASVQSSPARLTILPASISQLVYSVSFSLHLVETNENTGSGSGGGDGGKPLAGYELVQHVINYTIAKDLQLTTTQIGGLTISQISATVAQITITLFTYYDLLFNETLADIALIAQVNQENIHSDVASLEKLLRGARLRDVENLHIFQVDNDTFSRSDLKYFCPPGHSLQYNSFLCIGCAPGQYQTVENNNWVCRECGTGYYQLGDASTSCFECPSGRTTVRNGSKTIDDCIAQCQPGYYNPAYGVEPCKLCPDYTYQLEIGATFCHLCPNDSMLAVCLRFSSSSTTQLQTSQTSLRSTVPTMTAIIEDPTIEQNVIIIGLSTAVLFGAIIIVLFVMLVAVVVYRKRKSATFKDQTSHSIAFTDLSSSSSDSNVMYANTHLSGNTPSPYKVTNLSKAMQFQNEDYSEETWKKNPLYMDMDEFEEDYEINRAEPPNEDNEDQDEFMDVPVDLDDYISIHDDRQGLIQ